MCSESYRTALVRAKNKVESREKQCHKSNADPPESGTAQQTLISLGTARCVAIKLSVRNQREAHVSGETCGLGDECRL